MTEYEHEWAAPDTLLPEQRERGEAAEIERLAEFIYHNQHAFTLIGFGEFKWPNVFPHFLHGINTADGYRALAQEVVWKLRPNKPEES